MMSGKMIPLVQGMRCTKQVQMEGGMFITKLHHLDEQACGIYLFFVQPFPHGVVRAPFGDSQCLVHCVVRKDELAPRPLLTFHATYRFIGGFLRFFETLLIVITT